MRLSLHYAFVAIAIICALSAAVVLYRFMHDLRDIELTVKQLTDRRFIKEEAAIIADEEVKALLRKNI